jgi:hypothetical protein
MWNNKLTLQCPHHGAWNLTNMFFSVSWSFISCGVRVTDSATTAEAARPSSAIVAMHFNMIAIRSKGMKK